MKLFAGIDAGQSGTTAVIGDDRGSVIGRGQAGAADEVGQGANSTRLHDALLSALRDAQNDAGLPDDARYEAIVAGISGYEGRVYGVAPALPAQRLSLRHDSHIAHAAAFEGGPGVIVIAGTGSVAYGTNAQGETLMLGGWGYLFGDEGSAFWIGRKCFERATRDVDAGYHGVLHEKLLQHFQQPSLRALARAFYSDEISRAKVAQFAQTAFELWDDFDEGARRIIEQAADALAALAALTARRLHGNKRVLAQPVPVAFSGGLMRNTRFAEKTKANCVHRLPEAQIVEMTSPPAVGALRLAYAEA